MKDYLLMVEGCNWMRVSAMTPEFAFRCNCSWYDYGTRAAVMDLETGKTSVFCKDVKENGETEVVQILAA